MVIFLRKIFSIRKQNMPSKKIQLRILKQLTKLLGSGYSLIEALQVMQWDQDLQKVSSQIIESLKNGLPLADAFEQAHFHDSITSYLSFMQTSGDMKQHIEKCAVMYEHRVTYLQKMNQMMRYPLMLLILFSILLFFINRYVLPSFLDLFHSNEDMSVTVSHSITIIRFLGRATFITGLITIVIAIAWQFIKHKLTTKQRITIYRSIPIYRSFMTLHTSFLFATHLSTLLKSGMTIKQILQHLAEQRKLPIISYYSSLLISEFSRGAHIEELLKQLPLIENQFAIIFQKNNNMAGLEKDLTVYADLLIEQFHRKMMNTITLIQPLFFTILALFIIFIYLTLMWPMFDLIKTI